MASIHDCGKLTLLQPTDAHWPAQLKERLGASAPPILQAIGPLTVLAARRTALFCSARTPGDAILRAHDVARRMRDAGVTVISGFHSPIEKGCLRILLRGTQPIIVCPARAIEGMRIPPECRASFEAGRLLFLSPSPSNPDASPRDRRFVATRSSRPSPTKYSSPTSHPAAGRSCWPRCSDAGESGRSRTVEGRTAAPRAEAPQKG